MTISLVVKWNVERELEKSKQMLEEQLADALTKMLKGLLPICAGCKKIRDENGEWVQIDVYIQNHTDAKFTYGICSECKERLYPELYETSADSPLKTTK